MVKNNITKMIYFMFIIFILNNNTVYGYEKINFDKLSIKEGLSHGVVTCMIQDKNNVMWIGTVDGLNKYNGYDVEVYKYDENNKNSIASSQIVDIVEGVNDDIWVATDAGISKINNRDYSIKNYTNLIDKSHLKNSSTTNILVTKDKKVIVSTTEGISIYNEKKDRFEKLLNTNFSDNHIYSMTQDNEENIWISTKSGVDKLTKDFEVIQTIYNKELDIETPIGKIYYDRYGYIWCGTIDSGLIQINLKNDKIKIFQKDTTDDNKLQSNSIRDILRTKYGELWLCTGNGIAKYDDSGNRFITYKNKSYDKYSLMNDDTLSILEDGRGSIRVGTYTGVAIFSPSNDIKLYYNDPLDNNTISGNSIESIYEDEDGLLWIAIDQKGIDIIGREKSIVKHISTDEKSFLENNNVNYITGSGEKIYIATTKGLLIIDKKRGSIETYTMDNGLNSDIITILFLDSKDYLWIGTTKGINILDTKNNTILGIEKSQNRKIVSSLFEDSEGNYYIGYLGNNGLVKINPSENVYKTYTYDKNDKNSISSNSILSIAEDNDKNLWIGTKSGLNKLDKETNKFTRYTNENGLYNDTICGILVDEGNNIWVSTKNGISSISSKNNKIINLNILEGFKGNEFNQNAFYKNDKGEFFFGGRNGLSIFRPKEISNKQLTQKLTLEYFKIDDKKYSKIDDMKFNYKQNDIEIKFYVSTYKNINKTKYYYKLEGPNHNGKWSSTDETKIFYKNLSPGNYTFKLKAKGYDGTSSNEININFTIKEPIYTSNIAIFIYILLILGLIYLYKNRVKNLDELVSVKTKQLEKEINSNAELLNKTIELEKSKSRYFVNLSHELRTPLNVINGTTQLVNNIGNKDNDIGVEKVEYHMNVIDKNCKQLLGLIDNIIDSTKLEHDTYTINFEKNEVVSLVEECALGLKDYIESKEITFTIDTDIEEKFIKCDKSEIERCVINLIGNARKFTPSGGYIKVDIKDLGDGVEISVSDSGIGIEEKYLENIFNRFSQVLDMKKEAVKGGSGLGLTITKQIIMKHNGTIHVESELGKGSKFIIRLPIN